MHKYSIGVSTYTIIDHGMYTNTYIKVCMQNYIILYLYVKPAWYTYNNCKYTQLYDLYSIHYTLTESIFWLTAANLSTSFKSLYLAAIV